MTTAATGSFVGNDRHQLVADLSVAFDDVREGGGSRVEVLAAPTGWGKTRVIQEVYARLAAEGGGGYWPESLVGEGGSWLQARKRIFPPPFDIFEGTAIPYLWLGLSCQKDQMGQRLAALQYAETQFEAHVGPMAAALAGRGDRWKGRLGALGAVAGLFGLPDPVSLAMSWHGIATSAWELVSGEWAGFRQRREGLEARRVDTETGPDRVDRAAALAENVARLSGDDLPVLIVVDDAHWADAGTVTFVNSLLSLPGHVLVLATAWPDQLAYQSERGRGFGEAVERWIRGGRATRHDLRPLPDRALVRVVRSFSPEATTGVVHALVERADGNPNRLQGLLSLRVVRRGLAPDGPGLTAEQIEALPTGDREIYQAIWRELPENVRDVLALSTVQGSAFNPAWIPAAAELLDLTDAETGLARAQAPWGWVRSLDAALAAFVEAGLYERAEEESRTLFLPDELARARAAMLAWAVERKSLDDWKMLSTPARRAVLEAHVRGADDGFLAIDADVIDSVERLLGHLDDAYELDRYCEVAEKGIAWAEGIPELREAWWRMRHGLAMRLGELGKVDEAIEHLDRLLAVHTRERGGDHPDTHWLRASRAKWLAEANRFEEAFVELETAIPVLTERFGPEHWITLRARTNLAWCAHSAGQLGRAIAEMESLVATRTRVQGPDHYMTLEARQGLGVALLDDGRSEEALEVLSSLAEDRSRVLGEDHFATSSTRNAVAVALSGLDRDEEAFDVYRTLLASRERALGSDHLDTLTVRHNLASSLAGTGGWEEAIQMFKEVVAGRGRVLGDEHRLTILSRSNLAFCLRQVGREAEAAAIQREVLDYRVRHLGPDHPDTFVARRNLESGRLDRALAGGDKEAIAAGLDAFEVLVADEERALGADHPQAVDTRELYEAFLEESGAQESAADSP